jgi:two-component system CheB/CheR fusion protein
MRIIPLIWKRPTFGHAAEHSQESNLTAKKPAPPASPEQPAATVATDPAHFPIIGIGASAGGLGAFEAFFSGMPKDTNPGVALVLVQHLAPDHKSILSELLKRYTHMQVFEVTDGMRVEANCAYIIPPNRDMALLNGALHLLEPSAPRGQRLPSTISSAPSPRISMNAPFASCCRAPAATAPWASAPSRGKAGW